MAQSTLIFFLTGTIKNTHFARDFISLRSAEYFLSLDWTNSSKVMPEFWPGLHSVMCKMSSKDPDEPRHAIFPQPPPAVYHLSGRPGSPLRGQRVRTMSSPPFSPGQKRLLHRRHDGSLKIGKLKRYFVPSFPRSRSYPLRKKTARKLDYNQHLNYLLVIVLHGALGNPCRCKWTRA